MQGCVVHAPEVERVVDALRAIVGQTNPLDLRYVLVRASLTDGRCVVTLVSYDVDAPGITSIADALESRDDVVAVAHHVNDGPGNNILGEGPMVTLFEKSKLTETIGPVPQRIAPSAFSQVNPLAAAALYGAAVQCADASGHRVLDLYGGSGGIALSLLAAGAEHVTSIETNAQAIAAARNAAVQMGVDDRFEAREAPVEGALTAIRAAEIIVLNPPRKGVSYEVRNAIENGAWKRLVYVSCNPDTLARDIADWPGEIARVTPVDMFVHTHHVETVLLMQR